MIVLFILVLVVYRRDIKTMKIRLLLAILSLVLSAVVSLEDSFAGGEVASGYYR